MTCSYAYQLKLHSHTDSNTTHLLVMSHPNCIHIPTPYSAQKNMYLFIITILLGIIAVWHKGHIAFHTWHKRHIAFHAHMANNMACGLQWLQVPWTHAECRKSGHKYILDGGYNCVHQHSEITYLVGWKGVQASEQLFCGLVGERNLAGGNPLPRFFSSHPNIK